MFFLDFEQKRMSDEWVSNDLTLHDSAIPEPYASTNENSCNILPPIPEENFHMCEEIELEQLSVPNESANLAEAEHENIIVAKPPIPGLSNNPICEENELGQQSVCNPICEEIELVQQSVCNESANLTKAEHDSVVVSARKTVSYRSTKLSVTCMEQSFENYWKYQRKRPRDELQQFITTYNAEQLHCKPLRYCIKSVLFARFPKIKRPQIKENHELLLKEFGMQSKRSRKQQESEPAVEPTTDNIVQEPTTLVNDVPCNRPTNEIAHVDPVPDHAAQETTFFSENNVQDKQSYVSEEEVLGLLQHLWTEVPNEVPVQMIDVHIKNRRMAASVFMHQLDFCAKQIIGVVKDDNGAPKSFIKGPNWSFE
ncbi:uncharacterized protein LOC131262847 [Anopheles coustani]|uniref:uncharacterized protein LOC131262847 n=1 Tax=Anopheles coustani TaxID=139045 RepID=UPI0026596A3D|nr:uncharacterized protein LOC131262847 [Anopheles coustani]